MGNIQKILEKKIRKKDNASKICGNGCLMQVCFVMKSIGYKELVVIIDKQKG